MRLIDADELMEHVWRDRLDSRELIADMVERAQTIHAPKFVICEEISREIAKNDGFKIAGVVKDLKIEPFMGKPLTFTERNDLAMAYNRFLILENEEHKNEYELKDCALQVINYLAKHGYLHNERIRVDLPKRGGSHDKTN